MDASALNQLKPAPATGGGKPQMMVCTNPGTGEKIAEYRLHSREELREAFRRARIAQPGWAAAPLEKRVLSLMKVRDHIVDHIDEISEDIARDNGKTRVDAIATEVLPAAMALTYYCRNARRFLKDRKLRPGSILLLNKRSRIARIPFGVVGIISPWNYPFSIPFSEVVMALLAGNAVVLKTASETQVVGHALKKCIEAAGLPEGVFAYVNMSGSVAGDAFLEEGIDKLFFTGSVSIGKYLMKKASETLTPVSLELGGNDPMIVCEDADLDRAVAGAVWAGFQNAGQSCGGVERIYVDRKVYDRFMEKLSCAVSKLRVGYDTEYEVDVGAMTTKRQMDTVNRHVEDALAKGARVTAQSQCPSGGKGQFLPCTVLADVNHDMLVMKDETFGPVVGVMPFQDIEEAIRLSNDSNLGLTASVWSRDRRKAAAIGRRIRAGAVTINDHLMSHGLPETPWGGFEESGIGRTHGDIGFAEMTQPQVIVDDMLPLVKKNMWWHPHGRVVYEGLRGAATALYGTSLAQRIRGFLALLRVISRMFGSDLPK